MLCRREVYAWDCGGEDIMKYISHDSSGYKTFKKAIYRKRKLKLGVEMEWDGGIDTTWYCFKRTEI